MSVILDALKTILNELYNDITGLFKIKTTININNNISPTLLPPSPLPSTVSPIKSPLLPPPISGNFGDNDNAGSYSGTLPPARNNPQPAGLSPNTNLYIWIFLVFHNLSLVWPNNQKKE